MKLLTIDGDDEKNIKYPSRYDLNYWVRRPVKYLQVLPWEFELDINQIVDVLKKENVESIEILNTNNRVSLENLKEISFIKSLCLTGGGYYNTENISCLDQLIRLRIWNENYSETINVSSLKRLERLEIMYSCNNFVGFETLSTLKTLCIQKYPHKDLSPLKGLESLEALELIQPKVELLSGMETMLKMRCLTIFYSRKLSDISALENLNRLEYIIFENCPKISDYSILGNLTELKYLHIFTSKAIKSLEWLPNLKKLVFFSIVDTDVEDGNLENAIKIPYHAYTNKRHFNYYERNGIDIKK